MKQELIKNEIKKIFKKIAPEIVFDDIDLSKALRDQVEVDSVDFYKILVEINRVTGVNVPDSTALQMQNLQELIDYIERKSEVFTSGALK